MENSEIIKTTLSSVIELGKKSPLFNQFYEICLSFSKATINLNKNRQIKNEVLSKLGYSLMDMTCDCIADLFELRSGKFVHINNYFNRKFPAGIAKIHPDIVLTHLAVLIKSKTNQQISELRENLGEIYFKIKKSLATDLNRKKNIYKKFTVNGIPYIRLNHSDDYDSNLPQADIEYLTSELMEREFKNFNLSTILPGVFEILNSQDEFSKAISEKLLLEILKKYYTLKINGSVAGNVEYIPLEEGDEFDFIDNQMEEDERN
jgi:hypothetical protein